MSFYKAITTIGGLTLVSRVLGFLRDILTANYLGAGPVADAFFIALKLPNFFRRITAEGAFSVSFVPMFSKILADEGREEAKLFAEEAQAIMLAVLIPFTILIIAAMPWVLCVIAPGLQDGDNRYQLALEMSRITFPYILMMSLVALFGGILNSFDRFGPFAAAPIFFNGVIILFLVFATAAFPTAGHAMAAGVAVAGVVQFVWMLWFCRRSKFRLKVRKPKVTPRIKKLFKLMAPGAVGAGAAQINLFIDMVLASFLPIGSVSYLYYAERLYQLPLGIIGIAIGTALLPMLSRAIKSGGDSGQEAARVMGQGVETGLLLAVPSAIALVAIPFPMIQVLFQRGAFDAAATNASAYALIAYSVGLPAYILARVYSTAYFAREDTYTPVKFAIISAVINTLLALLLIEYLQHVGIALATGLTAWLNLALLWVGLKKKGLLGIDKDSGKRARIIIFCGALMAIVLIAGYKFVLNDLFHSAFLVLRVLGLAGLLAAGGIAYFGALYAFGILRVSRLKELFPKRQKQDKISG